MKSLKKRNFFQMSILDFKASKKLNSTGDSEESEANTGIDEEMLITEPEIVTGPDIIEATTSGNEDIVITVPEMTVTEQQSVLNNNELHMLNFHTEPTEINEESIVSESATFVTEPETIINEPENIVPDKPSVLTNNEQHMLKTIYETLVNNESLSIKPSTSNMYQPSETKNENSNIKKTC